MRRVRATLNNKQKGYSSIMASSLLINEPPLQVLPELAMIVGLNEAIILQRIHELINSVQNKNFFEGRKWICKTYERWREQFPFWSEITIKRTILSLEKKGFILSREDKEEFKNHGLRVKHYSIDYKVLDHFFATHLNHENKE